MFVSCSNVPFQVTFEVAFEAYEKFPDGEWWQTKICVSSRSFAFDLDLT